MRPCEHDSRRCAISLGNDTFHGEANIRKSLENRAGQLKQLCARNACDVLAFVQDELRRDRLVYRCGISMRDSFFECQPKRIDRRLLPRRELSAGGYATETPEQQEESVHTSLRKCVWPPNGSPLSCGRKARGRKAVERQTKRPASEATQLFPT